MRERSEVPPSRTAPLFAGESEGLALEEFERTLAQGSAQLNLGDASGAAEVLERALKFHPRHQRGRNLLGLALFKLGALDRSEDIYRGLIDDHPDDPTLRVNLGLVLLKAGEAAAAAHCFEVALELAPAHAKAQNYLGLALSALGEFARAKECFLRCGNAPMAEKMAQALLRSKASLPPPQPSEPVAPAADPSTPPPPAIELPSRAQRLAASLDALAVARVVSKSETPPEANAKLPVDAPGAPGRLRDGRPLRALELTNLTPPAGTPLVAAERTDLDHKPLQLQALATPVENKPAPPQAAEAAPLPPAQAPTSALSDYTDKQRLSVPAGGGGFVIGPQELLIHVHGEMLLRLDGMVASWGTMTVKPELKRFRGKATDKPFGEGARRMLRAAGQGRFVISREGRRFTALELGDEPAYFREETLFAFEETLMFENGRVPSRSGADLHLVHLRGHGRLLLCTLGQPRSAEVVKGEPLRIPMDQLVGWHGPNIQPRLVPICDEAPELGVALELAGEGRALVDAPDEPR